MEYPTLDFAVVKERADVLRIAACCGVALQGSGAERAALCPFHDEQHPSFGINIEKKVYYCHACGARGDIVHFVACLKNCSYHEAARHIAEWCGFEPHEGGYAAHKDRGTAQDSRSGKRATMSSSRGLAGTEDGNQPLAFRLQLDPTHLYLKKRRLTDDVIEHFGLGYCSYGVMAGRIAIPIHRCKDGALIGYSGRWASENFPEGTRRYRLPRGFRKAEVLYNLHRARGREHLVIVEGFWSVFRLHALGIAAVALMGCNLSTRQQELLLSSGAQRLSLLLDGDEPGRTATRQLLPRLARTFFVHAGTLPDEAQPDTVSDDILLDAVRLR